jgi:hypothetical protein
MIDIDLTLEARGKTYGDFGMGTGTEAIILQALLNNHEFTHGCNMHINHVIWLTKIITKLVRLSITPTHTDSWHDIAGYATLVEKELTKGDADAKSK